MQARSLLAVAMFGGFLMAQPVAAQGRGSASPPAGRPATARPAPRPAPPLVYRPAIPAGTVTTPFRGGRAPAISWFPGPGWQHRPIYFRSNLGLMLFDPYWWLAPDVNFEMLLPPASAESGPRLMGGLQLDVEPRRAFVYIDGVFTGTVDQFKGYFEHLETTAGYHIVEFVSPDYEPLITNITVVPGQTTTYRGFLSRANGR